MGSVVRKDGYRSHQELFDSVVEHLRRQEKAALLKLGGGAYRGLGGGSCPVGMLVGSNLYTTSMEGVPVRYVGYSREAYPAYMDVGVAALKAALVKARVNVANLETVALLSALQNVHDIFGTWEWHDRLRSIAREFGLSAAGVH
jgi:hypothetical protein